MADPGEDAPQHIDASPNRTDELAQALTQLSALLLDEESLETTLQRVADLAVIAIPGCEAAGVTLLRNGRFHTTAYTHDWVLPLDRAQYEHASGPCYEATRDGRLVLGKLVNECWPQLAAASAKSGVRSVLAAPLTPRADAIGALNLYSRQENAFDHVDAGLLALFTTQASVALLNAQVYQGTVELTEQLKEALVSRAVIEQAKGVLMARRRIGADEAFELLRRSSQRRNVKLRDVAQEVVDSTH